MLASMTKMYKLRLELAQMLGKILQRPPIRVHPVIGRTATCARVRERACTRICVSVNVLV